MTDQKMPELLPCPFCGGEVEQGTDTDPRPIICEECGLTMAGEYTIAKQAAIWNTRATVASREKFDIDEAVNRFLSWRLPDDFSPDAGVSFNPEPTQHMPLCWPTGTNLLNATQAKAMLTHVFASREQEGERVTVLLIGCLNALNTLRTARDGKQYEYVPTVSGSSLLVTPLVNALTAALRAKG